MKVFRASSARFFVIFAICGLAGCTAVSDNLPCPTPAVLEQGQTLTAFLPGRTDVAAQVTTARITGVAGECVLHKKQHALDVSFQAGFSATNGPANHGGTLNLPYAVWLTQGENIIAESDYTIALSFDGNASTAQATSKLIKIKLPAGSASGDLQILIGFKMTQDELDYAASHAGTGP